MHHPVRNTLAEDAHRGSTRATRRGWPTTGQPHTIGTSPADRAGATSRTRPTTTAHMAATLCRPDRPSPARTAAARKVVADPAARAVSDLLSLAHCTLNHAMTPISRSADALGAIAGNVRSRRHVVNSFGSPVHRRGRLRQTSETLSTTLPPRDGARRQRALDRDAPLRLLAVAPRL